MTTRPTFGFPERKGEDERPACQDITRRGEVAIFSPAQNSL